MSTQGALPRHVALGGRRQAAVLAFVLAASGIAAYWNCFEGTFVFDDRESIVANLTLRQPGNFWLAISPPINAPSMGRPVNNLIYALCYWAGGLDVFYYHLAGLVFHVAAGVALFYLLRLVFGLPAVAPFFERCSLSGLERQAGGQRLAVWSAFAISLLWLVHPVQTEAVTYLHQQAQVLMGMFTIFTLYAVARHCQGGRRAWFWGVAAVVACLLGMGSKQDMVVVPVLVLLFDYAFFSKNSDEALKRHWPMYVGLAATWGMLALTFGTLFKYRYLEFGCPDVPFWQNLFTMCRIHLEYMWVMLWPVELCLDFGYPDAGIPIVRSVLASLPYTLPLGAMLLATLWALWKRRGLGFLACGYFLLLAPSTSIVSLKADMQAEHRVYLAMALALTLAFLGGLWLRNWVAERVKARLGAKADSWLRGLGVIPPAIVVGVALAFGVRTHLRNHDYRSALGMWQDSLRQRPENARASGNIGSILVQLGMYRASLPYYQKALKLMPDFVDVHSNYGYTLLQLDRDDEAARHLRAALAVNPRYVNAHISLSDYWMKKECFDDAAFEAGMALKYAPDNGAALNNYCQAHMRMGRDAEAEAICRKQLELDAGNVFAKVNLSIVLTRLGKAAEGLEMLRQVQHVEPDGIACLLTFIGFLEQEGKAKEAADLRREVDRLKAEAAANKKGSPADSQ